MHECYGCSFYHVKARCSSKIEAPNLDAKALEVGLSR